MPEDNITLKMNDTQRTLREELIGRHSIEGFGLRKREVSVMTRMSADIVEVLDALVELEIFKSRSEAVAAFVEKAIASREVLFNEIKSQAIEIKTKKEAAKLLAMQAVREVQKKQND
jgi:Arc/MetJ-type ribon-helix-helix transcriptional regulator